MTRTKTKFSKAIFTLPLHEGSYPFRLTEQEEALTMEDWAWLFLRLNPLYQHDYKLWNEREANWAQLTKLCTDNGRIPRGLTVDNLDSRYFTFDGTPLSGMSNYLQYQPIALAEYLNAYGGGELFERIRVREFDAPRDYGLGAWVDPEIRFLPALQRAEAIERGLQQADEQGLPQGMSWFFNLNEPIWMPNTWALATPDPIFCDYEKGQLVQVGSIGAAKRVLKMTTYRTNGVEHPALDLDIHPGNLLPLNGNGPLTTQLTFWICLDGYVKAQVDMAFHVAEELLALHKEYYPKAVQRGAPSAPVEIVSVPLRESAHQWGVDSFLGPAATRLRKNWYAVSLDVAAALPAQKLYAVKHLIREQKILGDALTFPVRSRARGEDDPFDNALKRALCVFELHKYGPGEDGEGSPLSLLAMNEAIYCEDRPTYYDLRNLPVEKETAQRMGVSSHDGHPERIREALGLGKGMVGGWYEFLASKQSQDDTQAN